MSPLSGLISIIFVAQQVNSNRLAFWTQFPNLSQLCEVFENQVHNVAATVYTEIFFIYLTLLQCQLTKEFDGSKQDTSKYWLHLSLLFCIGQESVGLFLEF